MSITEVDADELEVALAGGARLVDVRETDEYRGGHVPGAVHIPLGTVADVLPDMLPDVTRGDVPLYVVCKSGGRSMKACQLLAERGIDAINVAGGTLAWSLSGRRVVEGDQPA